MRDHRGRDRMVVEFTNIRYSTIETKEFSRLKRKRDRHLSTNAEKETRYIQYGKILLFQ